MVRSHVWRYIDVGARGCGVIVRLAGVSLLREVCRHRGSTKGLGCTVWASTCPRKAKVLDSCVMERLLWRREQ